MLDTARQPDLFGDLAQTTEPEYERALTIQQRFELFHEANPHVYRRLVAMCRALREKGRAHFGIGCLWETMRYQFALSTDDPTSSFKLNDHYRSRYARLIMEREADLAEFFEVRRLRSA